MPSDKQKMLAGLPYDPADAELAADRARARGLCRSLNAGAADASVVQRDLLPLAHPSAVVSAPFFCDYGYHIALSEGVYFNVNCVLLDICMISVGANTLVGPGVHIYTVNHPLDVGRRRTGVEIGRPVTIGCDVWIGGACVICPGVEIGDGTVVAAGSVVTRSLPPGVLAAGNPCRVVRAIDGAG
jgi:maltose O-acetyltransferase